MKKLNLPASKEIVNEEIFVHADNNAIKEYRKEEKRIFIILKNYYEKCSSQQSLQSYYDYVEQKWPKEESSNKKDEGDMSCNNTSCTSKTKKKFKKLISFQNYIPRRKTFEDQINLAKGDMLKEQQQNFLTAYNPEEDETFAMMYTIYVAFWLSLNFRICSMMYTKNFQEDVANMCNSNFDKVKTFIFHEFQEKIKYIRRMKNKSKKSSYGLLSKITGIITDDVAEEISKMSLDFVTKKEDLEKKEPDRYSNGLIKWNEIKEFKSNKKTYKTIFPFDEEYQTSKTDPTNTYNNLYNQIKAQINMNVVAKIQNFFIKEITGNENSISMTYFEKYLMFPTFSASEMMWRDFLNGEFQKNKQTYATSLENDVIDLIYNFRKINEKVRLSGKK